MPWFPGLRRLYTVVDRSCLTRLAFMPTVGMKYKDFPAKHNDWLEDCSEWVFSEELGGIGDKTMTFIWNPVITAEMKATPFLSHPTTKVHPWPDVLVDVQHYFNASGYFYGERRLLHPGRTETCQVIETHWISDEPFTEWELRTDEPHPGEINFPYAAAPRIPDCLHPKIVIPTDRIGDLHLVDLTPQVETGEEYDSRTYQATNHLVWESHIFHNESIEDQGLYHRIQMEIIAPEMPPLIIVS